MKRNVINPRTCLAALMLCSFCFFAKSQTIEVAAKKYFGIDQNHIGIIQGSKIKILIHEGRWYQDGNNVFNIPAGAKNVFYLSGKIGVQMNSGQINIYESTGPGKWKVASESFKPQEKYDYAFVMGGWIATVSESEVHFFILKQYNPQFNFQIPTGALRVFPAGEGLMVVYKAGVDYYHFDAEASAWAKTKSSHFNFPGDTQGFIPLPGDRGFALVQNDIVKFYGWSEFGGITWNFRTYPQIKL